MKRFAAILFTVLLVWMPFASAPASTMICKNVAASKCGAACGGHMACCGTNAPTPPTIPPPSSPQNEVSLLAPAMIAWILPAAPASLPASGSVLPLTAMTAPVYARNCSRLL